MDLFKGDVILYLMNKHNKSTGKITISESYDEFSIRYTDKTGKEKSFRFHNEEPYGKKLVKVFEALGHESEYEEEF
jgi:hypothetical protein